MGKLRVMCGKARGYEWEAKGGMSRGRYEWRSQGNEWECIVMMCSRHCW